MLFLVLGLCITGEARGDEPLCRLVVSICLSKTEPSEISIPTNINGPTVLDKGMQTYRLLIIHEIIDMPTHLRAALGL